MQRFIRLRLNGVVGGLNGGKVAPLEFIGPLLKKKVDAKIETRGRIDHGGGFWRELTVRVPAAIHHLP